MNAVLGSPDPWGAGRDTRARYQSAEELGHDLEQLSIANTTCRRAIAILDRLEINEAFVLKKLARFNAAFDAAGRTAGDGLADLAEAIAGAIDAGEYHTANRLLSRGLAATAEARPR